jgi:3-hydroxyisobutyrate dehydrogenase
MSDLQQVGPGSQVGWIGTGVMGLSMCRRLLEADYRVQVYTRTAAKAQPLVELGAELVDSPAAASQGARCVLSIVGYPEDVERVYFGHDGLLMAIQPGQIVVDMTTSRPELAQRIAAAAEQRDAHALDAPVSGGDIGARSGRLSIMVGGPHAAFEALQPLWQQLGQTIVHHGSAGSGQHTKMANQILIAGNMIGLCEALLYAEKTGLDIPRVLSSVSVGAAGSWSLTNLAPRIVQDDWAPGFFVDHFVKDMGIALAEAERLRLSLPGIGLVRQLYIALQSQGGGQLGTQALIQALRRLNTP